MLKGLDNIEYLALKTTLSKLMISSETHQEGGVVSTQVGGRAVLSHVSLLRLLTVDLLLLDPARSDLQHHTLQDGDIYFKSQHYCCTVISVVPTDPHLQMMPAAGRHFLSPLREK